ncbi:MAG: hypothetical protein DPW11_00670 [bacterium]|nr:hypothetical protein [Candidatus Microgenomates bacterium CPR3]MCQ3944281.1 hypothetical protein [bacterium]RIK52045.1 MAG: hypothetical protein DCC61_00545 [Candidatus Microgenomates bacterium]
MSVWKQVGQNLAGLAKHVVKSVASEPVEVVKDMVGVQNEKGQTSQPNSPGDDPANQQMTDLAKAGFKTQDDYAKYAGLSGQKDLMEIEMLRKQLVREWGLDTNIESGMQKARMEYEQKEEQRKQIEEKKEEQKKEFEFQKKQQEDIGLKAATQSSSAENKAWGAG